MRPWCCSPEKCRRPGPCHPDGFADARPERNAVDRRAARAHQARIYVVSGSNPPPEVTAAADGFLLKPFNAEGLRRLIEGNQPEAAHSLLDPNEPVVSVEVLAQLRKVMPEPAVRQVYSGRRYRSRPSH
jgi:hypothetical protein